MAGQSVHAVCFYLIRQDRHLTGMMFEVFCLSRGKKQNYKLWRVRQSPTPVWADVEDDALSSCSIQLKTSPFLQRGCSFLDVGPYFQWIELKTSPFLVRLQFFRRGSEFSVDRSKTSPSHRD